MSDDSDHHRPTLRASGTYRPEVIEDIQAKAETGLYRIRGYGTLRPRRWATFDDLTFLPCSLTRIPLEGYREKLSTKTVLGKRFARKPIALDIPIMITGMSWGALSYNAKVALARGAAAAGSSNTTGDGGMLGAERENSKTLIYEVLPSRYGISIRTTPCGRPTQLNSPWGRALNPARADCCWDRKSRRPSPNSATCPLASISAAPHAIRISSVRTT